MICKRSREDGFNREITEEIEKAEKSTEEIEKAEKSTDPKGMEWKEDVLNETKSPESTREAECIIRKRRVSSPLTTYKEH